MTDATAEHQCLAYLSSTNRPYNTTDIHKNMHEPFSKAVAQKALTALAERGAILFKVASKSVVYCAKQDHQLPCTAGVNIVDDGVGDGDGADKSRVVLEDLDQRVTTLNQRVTELKSENKALTECT